MPQKAKQSVIEIDPEAIEVRVNGRAIDGIMRKGFLILKMLSERSGKVVTRDEILEKIFGIDKSMDIDTRNVDQHISRLRNLIGPEFIKTVHGFGYKFTPKVRTGRKHK